MSEPLPLRFVHATPLGAATVRRDNHAVVIDFPADAESSVLLEPNLEGDVAFDAARWSAVRLKATLEAEAAKTARLRLRGLGWAASHTELWQDVPVQPGDATLTMDTNDFRLCQNRGPAAYLRIDLGAGPGGRLTIHAVEPVEHTGQSYFAPRVDRFGQRIHGDWPNKIADEAELREAAAAPPPDPMAGRDALGAWADGPTFEATGFFGIEESEGVCWLVSPDGKPFLSMGSCCVSAGTIGNETAGRRELYAELPPFEGAMKSAWRGAAPGVRELFEVRPLQSYGGDPDSTIVNFHIANLIRAFGDDWHKKWGERTLARMRGWGMNTLACWSDVDLAESSDMPFILPAERFCPIDWGELSGAGEGCWPMSAVPDAFHPDFEALTEGWFEGLAAWRDEPRLLGYFVGNEQHWSLWGSPFAFPLRWASRKAFVDWLVEQYGTIEALNKAWNAGFPSFEDLARLEANADPPGLSERGKSDCGEFMRRFADRYFGRVREVLKRGDPNHLFWGCRYLALPPRPEVLAGASPHMDVVSINWYLWHKQTPEDAAAFLGQWHELTGKPLAITEWSFETTDERLLAGRITIFDRERRGQLTRDFAENCIKLPFVVGMHWFQYIDQAILGRTQADGERANFGLVDVADQPHREVVDAFTDVCRRMYDIHGR